MPKVVDTSRGAPDPTLFAPDDDDLDAFYADPTLMSGLADFVRGACGSLGLAEFDFDPYLSDFPYSEQLQNEIALARLSELTYRSPEVIWWHLRRSGFTSEQVRIICLEEQGLRALRITTDRYCVLAFRGTSYSTANDAKRNWMTNLWVRKTQTEKGKAHSGFLTAATLAFREAFPEMAETDGRVNASPTKDMELYLTGHSLGGALATVTLYLLEQRGWIDRFHLRSLCTFGQPPVGDKAFRNFLNKIAKGDYARYVNHTDPIPFIPPRSLFGLRQGGEFRYIDSRGEIRRKRNFLQIWVDRVIHYSEIVVEYVAIRVVLNSIIRLNYERSLVESHSCFRYIEALKGVAADKPVRQSRGYRYIVLMVLLVSLSALVIVPVVQFFKYRLLHWF